MLKAKLNRIEYTPKQTLGVLEIFDGDSLVFTCKTLERPWENNKIGRSCIPEGTYPVKYHNSPKFKRVLPWLQNTEPRTYILIHNGNYVTQIEGCILVGEKHVDINGDGLLDVTASINTLNRLMSILQMREFEITISSSMENK